MIASFLKIHPKIQSGEIEAENNMGVLLIEFFELVCLYSKNNSMENSLIMNKMELLFLKLKGLSISIRDRTDSLTLENRKIYPYRIHMMHVIHTLL
jgi:DNA polymerase sigma